MNVPRFWTRAGSDVRTRDGRPLALTAWGWSSRDRLEAEAMARERLARLVTRVEQGLELPRGYAYGERPLREEIVDELRARGEVIAVVTRNSYGSLVLNASRALFIDVDMPEPSGAARLGAWLGVARDRRDAEIRERLTAVLGTGAAGRFRIYRTAAGFRVLATDRLFEPASAEAEKLMTQVQADRAFVRLCRVQDSFRARLTPKPWRCGCERAPLGYPRESAREQRVFDEWRLRYERACASRAACRLVEEIGTGGVHPDVRPVLDVHDRLTRADSTLPLA